MSLTTLHQWRISQVLPINKTTYWKISCWLKSAHLDRILSWYIQQNTLRYIFLFDSNTWTNIESKESFCLFSFFFFDWWKDRKKEMFVVRQLKCCQFISVYSQRILYIIDKLRKNKFTKCSFQIIIWMMILFCKLMFYFICYSNNSFDLLIIYL